MVDCTEVLAIQTNEDLSHNSVHLFQDELLYLEITFRLVIVSTVPSYVTIVSVTITLMIATPNPKPSPWKYPLCQSDHIEFFFTGFVPANIPLS